MKTIHFPPFSTAAFCDEIRAAGATLSLVDGAPRIRWNELPPTVRLLEELKSRRGEIVEILQRERADATPVALGEAVAFLAALRLRYRVELNGDKVTVRGSDPMDERTAARIRELKPALVRLLEAGQ